MVFIWKKFAKLSSWESFSFTIDVISIFLSVLSKVFFQILDLLRDYIIMFNVLSFGST